MSAGQPGAMNRSGSPARPPVRAVIFDAGNTLLRMNYGVIADHLRARGRAASPAQVEDAELRARCARSALAHAFPTRPATHGRYLLPPNRAITTTRSRAIARGGAAQHPGAVEPRGPEAIRAPRVARAGLGRVISNPTLRAAILEETGGPLCTSSRL